MAMTSKEGTYPQLLTDLVGLVEGLFEGRRVGVDVTTPGVGGLETMPQPPQVSLQASDAKVPSELSTKSHLSKFWATQSHV